MIGRQSDPVTATDQIKCRQAAEPLRNMRVAKAAAASSTADLKADAARSDRKDSAPRSVSEGSIHPDMVISPFFSPGR